MASAATPSPRPRRAAAPRVAAWPHAPPHARGRRGAPRGKPIRCTASNTPRRGGLSAGLRDPHEREERPCPHGMERACVVYPQPTAPLGHARRASPPVNPAVAGGAQIMVDLAPSNRRKMRYLLIEFVRGESRLGRRERPHVLRDRPGWPSEKQALSTTQRTPPPRIPNRSASARGPEPPTPGARRRRCRAGLLRGVP